MPNTALEKLRHHLYLAVSLLLTGNPEQKVTSRKVLADFLGRFPAPDEPVDPDNPNKLEWWPANTPAKPGDDPRASHPQPVGGWVCFHCSTRYTTFETAKAHFETQPNNTPACLITHKDLALAEELKKVKDELHYVDSMLDTIKVIETKMINKRE